MQVSKDYNINWLQTEYNTAVRAARSAVNYRKALETKNIYPNLEYIESTASVQREEHLEYVGTILPIEHPWWDTHMPPSAWNCACSVRPTNKDVTEVPPADLVNPVFKNNPGKTAQIVNFKEHPYIKGICPYFNSCKRKDYGSQLKLDLVDKENPPIIRECGICKLAKMYSQSVAKRQKNIREWYNKNLPVLKVGKFSAKRFEVNHPNISGPIIINKNFYNEVSGKYVKDKLFAERLELAKKAHDIVPLTSIGEDEEPEHAHDAIRFIKLTFENNEIKIIFKCKENADGLFLHYMWHVRK